MRGADDGRIRERAACSSIVPQPRSNPRFDRSRKDPLMQESLRGFESPAKNCPPKAPQKRKAALPFGDRRLLFFGAQLLDLAETPLAFGGDELLPGKAARILERLLPRDGFEEHGADRLPQDVLRVEPEEEEMAAGVDVLRVGQRRLD